jgi:hypothetical protein
MAKNLRFRAVAGFGKRIEFWILGDMIRYGLDMYIPLVDDQGIDAIVRRRDGSFVELQIKARSANVKAGTETLFSVRSHKVSPNFWFVFYSEKTDQKWIMTSEEFVEEGSQTKTGKYEGLWWIKFDTKRRRGSPRGAITNFDRYLAEDYTRIEPRPPAAPEE